MHSAMPFATEAISWRMASVSGFFAQIDIMPTGRSSSMSG